MATTYKYPSKDPGEVLDYQLDWSKRLAGDIITSSSWVNESNTDIILSNESYANTKTTIWVSGGTSNSSYTLTNTVLTLGDRTLVQSVVLPVANN